MGSLLFVSLQAIINMGVVTGSMPTKGMSLPFISYGGSNLMVTFVFLGIIINVFRKWGSPKFRRPREIREI
jgi:cell division protein FtsW